MKKILSFLLLIVTAYSYAQTQVIIGENKDTTVITKTTVGRTVKVGRLTYADSAYLKDTTIVITKKYNPPATNQPPIARAGNDFSVVIPSDGTVTSTQLNGSGSTDPEGQVLKYFWRKVSGPACTLTDTTKPICQVSNMGVGTYDFELRAVDPLNAFSADRIIVTVQKAGGTSTSFPFSFTKNTAFKPRKFSGTEDWNGQFYTSFTGGAQDKYFRFVWCDIEKQTQGNYVWTRFDQEFQKAIALKGKFSFGIATLLDSDDFLAYETFTGSTAWARYPRYVHDFMQTQAVKDYVTNGQWVPAWNNDFFLTRYAALLQAIQSHIVSKGWQDKVNYVDIRGYGQWGEWHLVNITDNVNNLPAGIRPTVATYKRFIDAHISAFPDYPLVMLLATLDANWLPHTMTPPEVTNYALTAKNNFGLIGIRRDQWGAQDQYIHDYMENNNRSYGTSGPFKNIIMERWKYAPLVGEPFGPGADLSDLQRQVTFYHAASVGNGNYTNNTTSNNYFRNAENVAGYKLAFQNGEASTTSALDLSINFSVENFGNTPCYENYDLVYELKTTTGLLVWSGTSTFHPLLKVPGVAPITDNFKVTGVTLGTNYILSASFKNSYRVMPLFNNNQSTDGTIQFTTIHF